MLRFVGNALWALILVLMSGIAVATGAAWAWVICAGFLVTFATLRYALQRPAHAPARLFEPQTESTSTPASEDLQRRAQWIP